jgi:hypothetical protein
VLSTLGHNRLDFGKRRAGTCTNDQFLR